MIVMTDDDDGVDSCGLLLLSLLLLPMLVSFTSVIILVHFIVIIDVFIVPVSDWSD